jgi:hypothetical protein
MPRKTRSTEVNRDHECNDQNLDAKIREPCGAVLSGWMNFRGSERSASGNGLCLVLEFKYEVAPTYRSLFLNISISSWRTQSGGVSWVCSRPVYYNNTA